LVTREVEEKLRIVQFVVDESHDPGARELVSRFWSGRRRRENEVQRRFELANDFEAHRHRETLSRGHD